MSVDDAMLCWASLMVVWLSYSDWRGRRRYDHLREAARRYVAMTKDSFDPRSGQAWAREELAKLAEPEQRSERSVEHP